jgi:hypothetical protein
MACHNSTVSLKTGNSFVNSASRFQRCQVAGWSVGVSLAMYFRSAAFSIFPCSSRKSKAERTSLRVSPWDFSSLQMLDMPDGLQ